MTDVAIGGENGLYLPGGKYTLAHAMAQPSTAVGVVRRLLHCVLVIYISRTHLTTMLGSMMLGKVICVVVLSSIPTIVQNFMSLFVA